MEAIKTANLVLDEITPKDIVALYQIATRMNKKASDDSTYFHYYVFQPTPKDTLTDKIKGYINRNEAAKKLEPRKSFRYAVRKEGILIGSVAISMEPGTKKGQPFYGDLGYFIDPLHSKNGLMTEAINAVLVRFFNKFDRLDVTAHPENKHSVNLIKKIGGICGDIEENTMYNGEPRQSFTVSKADYIKYLQSLNQKNIEVSQGRQYE